MQPLVARRLGLVLAARGSLVPPSRWAALAGCARGCAQQAVRPLAAGSLASLGGGGAHGSGAPLHVLGGSQGGAAASTKFLSDVAFGQSAASAAVSGVRRASTNKDPERPKRPISPWLRFLSEYRATQKDVAPKDMMKAGAVQWKNMTDAARKPYEDPYIVEKQKYTVAFQAYKDSGKLEAWKRDPEKPKRPLTAFLRYTEDFRKTNTHLKMTECTKLSSEAWRRLDATGKKPYEEAYEAEKAKYTIAQASYASSGKEALWKAKVGLKEKQPTAAKKKAADAATKLKAREAAKKLKAKELLKKKEAAVKTKEKAAAKKEALEKKTKAAAKKKAASLVKKKADAQKKATALTKKKEAAVKKTEATKKKAAEAKAKQQKASEAARKKKAAQSALSKKKAVAAALQKKAKLPAASRAASRLPQRKATATA